MQSISTSNGPCQADTQTKLRAGGSEGKYRAIDRIDGLEMSRVRTINVALDDSVKRGTCGHQAELHLLEHDLGLSFDGQALDLARDPDRTAGYSTRRTKSPHRTAMLLGTLRASAICLTMALRELSVSS